MKLKTKLKTRWIAAAALFFATFAVSFAARAEQVPELTRFLEQEIQVQDNAVAQCLTSGATAGPEAGPEAGNEEWYFRNFWIRARIQFGFEIPGFAKMMVVPETELLWQREWPEGWTAYKP